MRKFKSKKAYISAIVIAAACIVVAVLCCFNAVKSAETELSQSSVIDIIQVRLTADGGNGNEVPKNTTFAIDDICSKGFTSIKIDARLTEDKKWVALEDADISAVTDGKGDVSEYRYYQLMNYHLKDAEDFTSPVIELTSDVAGYAINNSVTPIIYIHNYSKGAIRSLIEELSANTSGHFYIASSDVRILEYAMKVSDTQLCVYYVDKITDENMAFCKENPLVTLCFNADNNGKEEIEKLFLEEIPNACYGTETLREIEKFYKLGIRHFINDTIEKGAVQ